MSESPMGDDANRLGRVWLKEVSECRAVVLVTTLTPVYASESAGEGVAERSVRLSCGRVGHIQPFCRTLTLLKKFTVRESRERSERDNGRCDVCTVRELNQNQTCSLTLFAARD